MLTLFKFFKDLCKKRIKLILEEIGQKNKKLNGLVKICTKTQKTHSGLDTKRLFYGSEIIRDRHVPADANYKISRCW